MFKNTSGELGPICNNCGGYGYTNTMSRDGSSATCIHCLGSGIDERAVTAQRLADLEAKLAALTGSNPVEVSHD